MDNDTLIKVEDLCKIYNPGENEVRALEDNVCLKESLQRKQSGS